MARRLLLTTLVLTLATAAPRGHSGVEQLGPGTPAFEAETLKHFQALLQRDTSSPPGNEIRAVEYLKEVLDAEGIPYQLFAKDPQRPNLVVRMKGNGKKKWLNSWTPLCARVRKGRRTPCPAIQDSHRPRGRDQGRPASISTRP